jgi:AcrR family transcriptional regulator
MSSRRELNRAATLEQIKQAAQAQVEAEGAPALSIRGVARAIGMSPAGMYRYYGSRDDLLTDLLADAYGDLADAVAGAAGLAPRTDPLAADAPGPTHLPEVRDPLAAMLRAIEAYRRWAVGSPARFLLIFGTPVPGYEAPPEGPTVQANRRMGEVFFTLAALAWQAGQIAGPSPARVHPPAAQEEQVLAQLRAIAADLPAELIPEMLAGWALWHGLVTLEVTGQLDWIYPDTATFFTERMTAWLVGFAAGGAAS